MSALDLRSIARALGGEVQGRQVLAPGPGHSHLDRSLSVRPSASSPMGFVVHSHAGDDFATCRDFVAVRLGLASDAWRTRDRATARVAPTFTAPEPGVEPDHAARIARVVAIWNEAGDAHGTVVEEYLASRGLELPLGADVLRFHPHCPWGDKALGRTIFVPAMLAAMRAIEGDAIKAVHRTRLGPDGMKIGRRMLGVASGAAVKLDGDDAVAMGLAIGEGVETCLAARALGFCPTWALTSAGAVAAFPVIPGVEALTILAENDQASAQAIEACASCWHRAGREVIVVEPTTGSDLNDALLARGAP